MSTKTADWIGHTLDGRNAQYVIKTALGSGGMATVYLATDSRSGKEVAVKLPHEQILREEGFAARFTREIKSLIKLAHPNIVKVIDVGELNGAPFAVLQFLALGSLRMQQPLDLADGKIWPMRPDEIVGWLTPIADALDFVNRKGYVHRDVKPENIMFDAEGNPYLGDFGVIKARADVNADKPQTVATGAGLVLGTPHYMAPEVLMGETYDGRADQYSLAVTVYELLAARVPFPGDAPVAIVGHTTRPVPKLTIFVREMPADIEKVVLKGLSKKKEDRYRDCRAFADAFAAAVKANMPATPVIAAAPVASSGRSITPPPVPSRSAAPIPPPVPRMPTPPGTKRTAPIKCPYCRYEVNLPDHVRSKAIRCAGCRKVYLLDQPSPSAGTAKQEQVQIETRRDERRPQPPSPPPDVRTPRPRPIEPRREEARELERLQPIEPRREEAREVEPEPRRRTPPSTRSRREPEPKPVKPPKPPKPKGPPLWQQPWFRKLVRFGLKTTMVLVLLGLGGVGILFGYNWYQVRDAKKTAALSEQACNEGHYTEAVKYAESAMDKDSDCAPAYAARGRARFFQGDHEGALLDLNKAIDLDPTQKATPLAYRSAVQLSRGLLDEGLEDAKAATTADPNIGVAHAYLGLAKLETGASDAEGSCDVGVTKSPENPEVYRVRALVRRAMGKQNQAEADINTAVAKSGESAFYLASRGLFSVLGGASNQFDANNFSAAVPGANLLRAKVDGENATKKDSTCGYGHLSVAVYYIRNNSLDAAMKSAESAIGASPKLAAAYETAHFIAWKESKSEGLTVLNRGIAEIPTSPRLRLLRGQARKTQSNFTGAIDDFSEYIRQAPNDPEGYQLRGGCYSRNNDPRSIDDFERSKALQRTANKTAKDPKK